MSSNNSSPAPRLIPFLIILAILIGLYYLYQYLFGIQTLNSYSLITSTQVANVDSATPIIIASTKLPGLYEGGEFSVSTWIYVNNWTYHMNRNKAILILGGPNFDTVRIYLGATKPTLKVRFHTRETGTVTTSQSSVQALPKGTRAAVFTTPQTDSGLLDASTVCDLPEIDLQRWVHLTVAVNGRTSDIYLDGKLARSCVLPANFKVDPSGYSATLLPYGGFGGQISKTTMYDAALNPESVYKNYMLGPSA
jgi:Concanavalin A-like lectin/glucanases superfamily